MDTNTRLSQLRDALHTPPNRAAFEAICALFEGWSRKDGLKVGLDYAAERMAHWPRHLRQAPTRACAMLPDYPKRVPAFWPLVHRAEFPALDARSLRALLRARLLAKLDWLEADLRGKEAVKAFVAARQLSKLRVLKLGELDGTRASDMFVEARHLTGLEVLDLRGNQWMGVRGGKARTDAIETMANNKTFARLRRLNIDGCRPGLHSVEALATSLTHLEALDLGSQRWTSPHSDLRLIQALCASQTLQHLRELDLSGRGLGQLSVQQLAGKNNLSGLTHLSLRDSHIGDEGLETIARSKNLPALHHLDIGNTHGTDAGLMAFVFERELGALATLVPPNNASSAALEALEASGLTLIKPAPGRESLWDRAPLSGEETWLPDVQTRLSETP